MFNKYLKSLKEELKVYSNNYNLNNLKTLYIGGGNPGLNPDNLYAIHNILSSSITLSSTKEYTIESNPLSVNSDLINVLKEIGCNRVSLGIQSFNKKVLDFCNRTKQDIDIIQNALRLLQKDNFLISIELINGLPFTDYNF